MSLIRNRLDSHILLNVERIDLNENFQKDNGDSEPFEKRLHGIMAEAFEHLKGLRHPNVCRYTNMLRLEGNVYLLVSEGYSLTMNRMLEGYSEEFATLDFVNVIDQALCGLMYLHTSGFSHGRLSLECLCLSDEGLVKISGYATNYVNKVMNYLFNKTEKGDEKIDNPEFWKNYVMSPLNWEGKNHLLETVKESTYLFRMLPYMPLELLFFNPKWAQSHEFWYNVDVWSLGICILITMSYIITERWSSWEDVGSRCQTNHTLTEGKMTNGIKGGKLWKKEKNKSESKGYFENLKKVLNSESPDPVFVDSFLFVSQMLTLISKMESTGEVSTVGLDIPKILNEQFKFLNKEEDGENVGVIAKIFEELYKKKVINHKENYNNGVSDERELRTKEESLLVPMELLTGGNVLRSLVEIEQRLNDKTKEYDEEEEYEDEDNYYKNNNKDNNDIKLKDSDLKDLYYLLSLAYFCLKVNNTSRPSIVDLCAKNEVLKLGKRKQRQEKDEHTWVIYRDKEEEEAFTDNCQLEQFKEYNPKEKISESSFFLNYVGLENVLYYWSLLGNELSDIVPFDFKTKVRVEEGSAEVLRGTNSKCNFRNHQSYLIILEKDTIIAQTVEYFKRYKVGRVFLEELMNHVNMANLFPMIIEHQLRPSCVYARQDCFIYQLLRIRRFNRLLNNPVENKKQIYVEAMIDIPPLLRNQIWCNLLEINHRWEVKDCPTTSGYDFEEIPPEVEQKLRFYNNDVLYSSNNVKKLVENVDSLKKKIMNKQMPSSIYSLSIPLLILYHDSKVYSKVLETIFNKYLKEFYDPTGSFVNNYLSQFSTILNFFDPEVSCHLRKIGAYADSYALPWFMSLFAENTSVEHVYLIWDSILVHPKQYIKFLGAMIIHNVRERLLEITDASRAIGFMSCVMDSLNVPMLMYLTTHMYKMWSEVFNPKSLGSKSAFLSNQERQDEHNKQQNEQNQKDKQEKENKQQNVENEDEQEQKENKGKEERGKEEWEEWQEWEQNEKNKEKESFNLDKNTFVFLSEEYPIERCFKITIETFSNIFNNCIIIDLRSIESYNMGHIPNSIHIKKILTTLSETDKKTQSKSIAIFNEHNGLNTNMEFKKEGGTQSQIMLSLQGLKNSSKKPWLHLNTQESSKVLLAAGDGYDTQNEMLSVRRLIFEFNLQHVCYYRINTEEWPKVFTLSKM